MAIKSLTVRIDEALLDDLHRVADYEGRSASSQTVVLIRDCVEKYKRRERSIPQARNKQKPKPPAQLLRRRLFIEIRLPRLLAAQ